MNQFEELEQRIAQMQTQIDDLRAFAYKGKYSNMMVYNGDVVIQGNINGSTIQNQPMTNLVSMVTETADSVPSDLAVSTHGITTGPDGTQTAYVAITWTALVSSTFDHYLVRYKKHAYTAYEYLVVMTNLVNIDGLVPNTAYDFGVASVNKYGTQSNFCTDINQTTDTDTVAPATVAGLSGAGGIQYSLLTWTANTETDLASYNVYRSETNNSTTAVLVGNTKANTFIDGNRTGGTTYYYWVKAIDTSGNVSANFSTGTSATPRNVTSDDIVTIAGSKVLIDGVVYLSNWQKAGDVTKIDGGQISANTITTTQLNFTPMDGSTVIATINASTEGIKIDADNLSISSSTTFASGYDPSGKVAGIGGTYDSAASGARVRIFPDANTGIQIIDNSGNDMLKALVGGTDVGDVIIGNYAAGEGFKYDKSANKSYFNGTLAATGGGFGAITSGSVTLDTAGFIKGGQTDFKTGDGFFQGYSTTPELEMWDYPNSNMADYVWANGTNNPIGVRFPLHTGAHYVKEVVVQLKLASAGTSQTIYCDIYEADSNFKPTGSSLGQTSIAGISNTAYEEKTFSFSTPVAVADDSDYVAVFTCASTTPAIHFYYSSFISDYGFRVMRYTSSAWSVEASTSQPWIKIYSSNAGYKFSIGNDNYNLSYNASNLRATSDFVIYDTVYADRFASYQSWGVQLYSLGQNTLLLDEGSNGLHWFAPKTATAARYSLGGIKPYYTLSGANIENSGLEIYGSWSGGIYLTATANDIWKVLPKSGTTLVFGSGSQKVAVYCNGLSSCPLPTVDNALAKLETVPSPKEKTSLANPQKAHFENKGKPEKRKYFDIADMPEDCRFVNDEGEDDVEIIRTVGFLMAVVRELHQEVKSLKSKIKQ